MSKEICSPHSGISIEIKPQKFAKSVGVFLFFSFFLLGLLGLVLSSWQRSIPFVLHDLLQIIGALAVYFLSLGDKKGTLVWTPLYFSFGLGSALMIGQFIFLSRMTTSLDFQAVGVFSGGIGLIQLGLYLVQLFLILLLPFMQGNSTVPQSNHSNFDMIRDAYLAEVGSRVGVIAHDLAQPLQVIMISATFLKRLTLQKEINPDALKNHSNNIAEATLRLSALLVSLKESTKNIDRVSVK